MQTSVPLPNDEILTSWKEIASYLNKGVRTVQRWEAEFGLPVRRPRERARGIVHASRFDLDMWMKSNWARRAERALDEAMGIDGRISMNLHRNRQLVSELSVSIQKLQNECESIRKEIEKYRSNRGSSANTRMTSNTGN